MASVLVGLTEENKQEIKSKIEYYLSDENLEHDSYLREKISQDPNGYVELSVFLNYDEIKSKEWSRNDLRKGAELSNIIEVDDYGEKVRRKGNKQLPELNNKNMEMDESSNILRKEEDENINRDMEQEQEQGLGMTQEEVVIDDKIEKIPLILRIKFNEKSPVSWRSIDEFKKLNPGLNIEYSRLKDIDGYIVINLQKEQKYDDVKFISKFSIENLDFSVERCEGDELGKFWKDVGPHYEYYMKRKEKLNKLKLNKDQRQKELMATEVGRDREHLHQGSGIKIKLGNKEYYDSDIDLIRKDANNILRKYSNNEKIEGEDKEFIMDLLKYHSKYEEITRNLDFITVDINERFKFLKSFYIVEKNGGRIKFSSKSCVQNIAKKFNIE